MTVFLFWYARYSQFFSSHISLLCINRKGILLYREGCKFGFILPHTIAHKVDIFRDIICDPLYDTQSYFPQE